MIRHRIGDRAHVVSDPGSLENAADFVIEVDGARKPVGLRPTLDGYDVVPRAAEEQREHRPDRPESNDGYIVHARFSPLPTGKQLAYALETTEILSEPVRRRVLYDNAAEMFPRLARA